MKKKSQTPEINLKKREIKTVLEDLLKEVDLFLYDDELSTEQKEHQISVLFQDMMPKIERKVEEAAGHETVTIAASDKKVEENSSPAFWRTNLDYGERERVKEKLLMEPEKHLDKKAVIRDTENKACPFGLPIPQACRNAGESITRMAAVEEGDSGLRKANRIVYAHHKTCKQCPYADKILDNFSKVDCDFGDVGEGLKSTPFAGSPLYPRTFHGYGFNGLYGYPLGFYADNNESRNLFFGLFSLLGKNSINGLKKYAEGCGEKNNNNRIVLDMVKKLMKIKEEYTDVFDELKDQLKKYRDVYEEGRYDPGKVFNLMKAK